MDLTHTAVVAFSDHRAAEIVVQTLVKAGFDLSSISVIVKGFAMEEDVVGFYGTEHLLNPEGLHGPQWQGLWSLFFDDLHVSIPAVGPVIVLGYLAGAVPPIAGNRIMVCGLVDFETALGRVGLLRCNISQYVAKLNTQGYLVMVRGTIAGAAYAQTLFKITQKASSNIFIDKMTEAVPILFTAQPSSLSGLQDEMR